MRTALQVKPELDLLAEIVLHLRERGGEHRIAKKKIDTEQNDGQDEQRFPLQIGIHGQKIKHTVQRRAGLFCIFRCLHLSNRRARDADFYLRFAGNFQNDGITIETVDSAVDAATGDHFVTSLQRCEHGLHLLALALLGQDHEEIHDDKHEAEWNQQAAKG